MEVEEKALEVAPETTEEMKAKAPTAREETVRIAVEGWTVDCLGEKLRQHYEKVKAEGAGVCSRCRWA